MGEAPMATVGGGAGGIGAEVPAGAKGLAAGAATVVDGGAGAVVAAVVGAGVAAIGASFVSDVAPGIEAGAGPGAAHAVDIAAIVARIAPRDMRPSSISTGITRERAVAQNGQCASSART